MILEVDRGLSGDGNLLSGLQMITVYTSDCSVDIQGLGVGCSYWRLFGGTLTKMLQLLASRNKCHRGTEGQQ